MVFSSMGNDHVKSLPTKHNRDYKYKNRKLEASSHRRGTLLYNNDYKNFESYFKNHLYIKSRVDTTETLFGVERRISFRNYIPKVIIQEINMGMWI